MRMTPFFSLVFAFAVAVSASSPIDFIWVRSDFLNLLERPYERPKPFKITLKRAEVTQGVDLLESFCSKGVFTHRHIDAAIHVLELLSEKITSSHSYRLYGVMIKLISVVDSSSEFTQSWLKTLSTKARSIPSEFQLIDFARALCRSKFDHLRDSKGFIDLVSNLTVRFTPDQIESFFTSQIMDVHSLPHLELFARHIPPDSRLDILRNLISKIASIRMSLHLSKHRSHQRFQWEDHDKQLLRIELFHRLARACRIEAEIIHFLLKTARENLDRSREHYYIALQLMHLDPGIVQSNISLLFELLPLSKARFRWKRRIIRSIVKNLPESCFRQQAEYGRTILDLYVEVNDLDYPTFKKMEDNTPIDIVHKVRRNALASMDPDLWHALFLDSNFGSINALGVRRFFNDVFENHEGRGRFEATVLLDIFQRYKIRSKHDVAMKGYCPKLLVKNCRLLLDSFSKAKGQSILHFIDYCERANVLKDIIDEIPAMFSNPDASAQFIAYFADSIVSISGKPSESQPLVAKVQDIGQKILSTCQRFPWLCDIFVRFFVNHFRHDEMLFSRSEMTAETSISSLYIIFLSLKQYKSKPYYRITSLIDASLDKALTLHREGGKNAPLEQSIIALALKIAKDLGTVPICFRLLSGQLVRFPLNVLTKPFRALWKEQGFDKFARALFSTNQLLTKYQPLLSHGFHRVPITAVSERRISKGRMRIREIVSIEDDYEIIKQIGYGSYGTVYQARVNDHVVAIKKMGLRNACVDSEVEFMSTFCHSNAIPGLVQLLDIAKTEYDIYLVMELIEGQRLYDWKVPDDPECGAKELVSMAYKIIITLHRLHEVNLFHGDLHHCGNFMVEHPSKDIVLIDFGFTKQAKCVCQDGPDMYDRFMELLLKVKEKFELSWYEPAPESYRPFEAMLRKLRHRSPNCSDFLVDPVFENLCSEVSYRKSLQASEFPIRPEFESLHSDSGSDPDADHTNDKSCHHSTSFTADQKLFSPLSEITPFGSSCSDLGSPFAKPRESSVMEPFESIIVTSEASFFQPPLRSQDRDGSAPFKPRKQWNIPIGNSSKRSTPLKAESGLSSHTPDESIDQIGPGTPQAKASLTESNSSMSRNIKSDDVPAPTNSQLVPEDDDNQSKADNLQKSICKNFTETKIDAIIGDFLDAFDPEKSFHIVDSNANPNNSSPGLSTTSNKSSSSQIAEQFMQRCSEEDSSSSNVDNNANQSDNCNHTVIESPMAQFIPSECIREAIIPMQSDSGSQDDNLNASSKNFGKIASTNGGPTVSATEDNTCMSSTSEFLQSATEAELPPSSGTCNEARMSTTGDDTYTSSTSECFQSATEYSLPLFSEDPNLIIPHGISSNELSSLNTSDQENTSNLESSRSLNNISINLPCTSRDRHISPSDDEKPRSLPVNPEKSHDCNEPSDSLGSPGPISDQKRPSSLAASDSKSSSESNERPGFTTTILIWLSCGFVTLIMLAAASIYVKRTCEARRPRLIDLSHSQS